MRKKVVIIGFGSIGKRHATILKKIKKIKKIYILSKQKNIPFEKISYLEQIKKINPDYIVISSPTFRHVMELFYCERNFMNKIILVEKPIFEKIYKKNFCKNKIYVGYNLRFHPVIKYLKRKLSNKKIWSAQIFCGSYLPDWRKNRKYFSSYSANKEEGGGVLLDLSHEFDYAQWILGPIYKKFSHNDKISNLKIKTDDYLNFFGETTKGTLIQINLNYFTRKSTRLIIVDGKNLSIQADLVNNVVHIVENNKLSKIKFPKNSNQISYINQHREILSSTTKSACTFNEAMTTMKLINKIRNLK